MTESKQFLNFFKKNLLLFLLLPLLCFMITLVYLSNISPSLNLSRLYQLNYQTENAEKLIPVADQIVSTLRSQNLQQSLDLSATQVTVFKPGPLSIQINLTGANKEHLNNDLSKLGNYISTNYSLKQIGTDFFSVNKINFGLYLFLSLIAGLFIALLISLTKEYLKNY